MSSLAQRVTEAIEESGVDVEKIAKACDVSVQAVYKWMRGGSKTISGLPLMELARVTNFEARWIINGKGPRRQDPKVATVCRAMEDMPEYKKDAVVQTSIALAEQPKPKGNGTL